MNYEEGPSAGTEENGETSTGAAQVLEAESQAVNRNVTLDASDAYKGGGTVQPDIQNTQEAENVADSVAEETPIITIKSNANAETVNTVSSSVKKDTGITFPKYYNDKWQKVATNDAVRFDDTSRTSGTVQYERNGKIDEYRFTVSDGKAVIEGDASQSTINSTSSAAQKPTPIEPTVVPITDDKIVGTSTNINNRYQTIDGDSVKIASRNFTSDTTGTVTTSTGKTYNFTLDSTGNVQYTKEGSAPAPVKAEPTPIEPTVVPITDNKIVGTSTNINNRYQTIDGDSVKIASRNFTSDTTGTVTTSTGKTYNFTLDSTGNVQYTKEGSAPAPVKAEPTPIEPTVVPITDDKIVGTSTNINNRYQTIDGDSVKIASRNFTSDTTGTVTTSTGKTYNFTLDSAGNVQYTKEGSAPAPVKTVTPLSNTVTTPQDNDIVTTTQGVRKYLTIDGKSVMVTSRTYAQDSETNGSVNTSDGKSYNFTINPDTNEVTYTRSETYIPDINSLPGKYSDVSLDWDTADFDNSTVENLNGEKVKFKVVNGEVHFIGLEKDIYDPSDNPDDLPGNAKFPNSYKGISLDLDTIDFENGTIEDIDGKKVTFQINSEGKAVLTGYQKEISPDYGSGGGDATLDTLGLMNGGELSTYISMIGSTCSNIEGLLNKLNSFNYRGDNLETDGWMGSDQRQFEKKSKTVNSKTADELEAFQSVLKDFTTKASKIWQKDEEWKWL